MTVAPAEITIARGSRTCPACGLARKSRGRFLCWPCQMALPRRLRHLAAAADRRGGPSPTLASWSLSALGATQVRLARVDPAAAHSH